MDDVAVLAKTTEQHSQAIFGRSVDRSQLTVSPLALGTRRVFTVAAADARLPRLVVKQRVQSRTTAAIVAAATVHEFHLHRAVWDSLRSADIPEHTVPRPVLALPAEGLLFMERAEGIAVKQSLQQSLWRPGEGRTNIERAARCGAWLYTFACRAPRIVLPEPTADVEAVVTASRSRHHVYSLIGLGGQPLVDAMLGQVGRRLDAYGVPADVARPILGAFERVLGESIRTLDEQTNVHGKYSVADVLTNADRVVAIDLEQAGHGSMYLDAAYFLFQVGMVVRWNVFTASRVARDLRRAFLAERSPSGQLDERLLATFIAYYLVNSLRPGDLLAGLTARLHAKRWIEDWLKTV